MTLSFFYVGLFLLLCFTYLSHFMRQEDKSKRCLVFFNPLLVPFIGCVQKGFLGLARHIILLGEEKKASAELPLFIESMRSCLKAGLSIDAALDFSLRKRRWCKTVLVPMGTLRGLRMSGATMRLAIAQARCVLPARRTGRLLNVFLVSLLVAHMSGGDLVHLLEKTEEKVRASIDLNRKLAVQTAQMRLQAWVIGFAPVVLAIVLWIFDEQRITFFFSSLTGYILSFFMMLLYFFGIVFLKKAGDVDE